MLIRVVNFLQMIENKLKIRKKLFEILNNNLKKNHLPQNIKILISMKIIITFNENSYKKLNSKNINIYLFSIFFRNTIFHFLN